MSGLRTRVACDASVEREARAETLGKMLWISPRALDIPPVERPNVAHAESIGTRAAEHLATLDPAYVGRLRSEWA